MIRLKDNIEDLLDSLSKSKFRGSFHLNKKMTDFCKLLQKSAFHKGTEQNNQFFGEKSSLSRVKFGL